MTGYRPDIDGLRAIAVIAVVLFHAHLGPFGGGFVGVDVFFVISGYLIVGIILDDIGAATFSAAAFYERRVRRLFPALVAMLVACSAVAYLCFLPQEFLQFGQSVAATAAFVSNFLFWNEAGYFDSPPELKPLLHTWSLAVEEQFYLLFPALLVAVSKYTRASMNRAIWIVAIVSFAFSTTWLVRHPDAAFYLPHTRMWELAVGALLVSTRWPLPTSERARSELAVAGLLLIVIAATLYSAYTPFPGPAALLPCIGTALIIHSGRGVGSPVHALLARRPLVHVGLISYSLYLWHWPILVFARALVVRPLTTTEACGCIALAFVLAQLSWRFVEAPFRHRPSRFSRTQIFALASAATAALFATGGSIMALHGLPARVPPAVAVAAAGATDQDRDFRRRCYNFLPHEVSQDVLCKLGVGGDVAPTFILWGDSHAYALAPVVAEVARDRGMTGLLAGSGGCAPLLGVERMTRRAFDCRAFNDAVVRLILDDATLGTVIIASRWILTADGRRYGHEVGADTFVRDAQSRTVSRAENLTVFRRGLERTLAALNAAGKRVIVVGPIPEVGVDVPSTIARALWFRRDVRIEPTSAAFLERQRDVLAALHDAHTRQRFELVQPSRVLCDAARCTVGSPRRPYYVDDNHLSIAGALALRTLIDTALSGDATAPRISRKTTRLQP